MRLSYLHSPLAEGQDNNCVYGPARSWSYRSLVSYEDDGTGKETLQLSLFHLLIFFLVPGKHDSLQHKMSYIMVPCSWFLHSLTNL